MVLDDKTTVFVSIAFLSNFNSENHRIVSVELGQGFERCYCGALFVRQVVECYQLAMDRKENWNYLITAVVFRASHHL